MGTALMMGMMVVVVGVGVVERMLVVWLVGPVI